MKQNWKVSIGREGNWHFSNKWLTAVFCAGLVVFSTGCAKLQSRDEMNKGVQAYKNAHYTDAAKHFKEAIQLDPTNRNARLYLATSYMTQWVPGAESADNKKNYEMANQTFQQVLDNDPNNSLALASMASMSFNKATSQKNDQEKTAALEETKKWNERRVKADPKDDEAYYYLGVIDWSQSYPPIRDARTEEKMKPDDPGPIVKDKTRNELKDKYGAMINSGISDLHKAIDINRENEDAMSYLNLLLRSKASLEETKEEAKADIEQANKWADKSVEMKRIKATRPQKKTQES